MTSKSDPVQDWAGIWIQEQQRFLQQWVQSQQGDDPPTQLATTAMQAWQSSCELWQNSISEVLPARLAVPFETLARQSREDLLRALHAAQSSNQNTNPSPAISGATTALENSFNPFNSIANMDLGSRRQDPAWIEHLQAFNDFIQFHIQLTIAGLNKLKTQLNEYQGQDIEGLGEEYLEQLLRDYQNHLQSSEYQKIFDRLVNSITVQSKQSA